MRTNNKETKERGDGKGREKVRKALG